VSIKISGFSYWADNEAIGGFYKKAL